jgi:cysteine desulfurase
MNFLFPNKRIYLDYASTTPVSSSVKRAMDPFWSRFFHNPNGLHKGSVRARKLLDGFRAVTASFFGSHADEVIFTSGGTESDNLAILGSLLAYKKNNPNAIPHIIVSAIEHPAVLEVVRVLEMSGEARVSYLPVDEAGVVLLDECKKVLTPDTVLISLMYVNNEVGTIEPIHELVKLVRHFKKHTLGNPNALYPLVHTDASQALLYQETNIQKLGVDMLSCNGGKIYGPKGVGVLVKKRNVPLEPLVHGGNQEFGFRAGTHALPLIAGMATALSDISKSKEKENKRLTLLHDFLVLELQHRFSDITIHGSLLAKVPGIVNISCQGIESDLLVLELDALGFEVSSKTACKYDDPDESYVLQAMRGDDADEEGGTVRISLGRHTSRGDLRDFLDALGQVLQKYKDFQKKLDKKI